MTKHGANIFDLCEMYNVKKEELMDFSSNINPFGSSQKAKNIIIDNIDMVAMYPDPEYKTLKNSISTYAHVKTENILLGSGATELISAFIDTINPKKALLLAPSYSEYDKELTKIGCDTSLYYAKKENDFKIDVTDFINTINSENFDMVIICNPNNPTGFAFSRAEVATILEKTNTFIMLDETYIEFSNMNVYSCTELVDEYNKLFIIRGTSKFFGTPGIRLGYGLISDKPVYKSISKHLDLWNINIFATLMGEVMFVDNEYIDATSIKVKKERDYLLSELNSLSKIKVFDTSSNFILCEIKNDFMTARTLYEKLIKDKIIIRDCASFDGLSKYFFRVCLLSPSENKLLIKALKEILA